MPDLEVDLSEIVADPFDLHSLSRGLAGIARALNAAVDDAVTLFVHGAKTLHVGYYLDNKALEMKGLAIIDRAVEAIDTTSPSGRDVLLPLLDHREDGVRAVAAAGLWQSHPDRAIPLLQQIKRYSITEAGATAMIVLMAEGRMNMCGSDPRYPSLYCDEDGVYRWEEPAFRDEVFKQGRLRDEALRRSYEDRARSLVERKKADA